MPLPLAALAPLAIHLLPAAASAIGQALAGERGAEVGRQLGQAVEAATGTDDPDAAREVLERHPEAARAARVELERLLADHALAVAREETERRRIAAADTADARQAALETLRAGGSTAMRDMVVRANILLFAASAAGAVTAIILDSDPLVVATVSTVLGATIASYKDTTSYFLGSSQGSADKDARLARIQGNRPG